MRFTVNKENLLYGLTYVNRVIPTKSDIPYLTNVLIKSIDDEIELFGTDMEQGIKTTIPAQIDKDGEILINAKVLIDMVKKLPQGKPIQIEEEENEVIVRSGRSSYNLVKLSPEEFPLFPTIEGKKMEFFQKDILDIIKKVKFSVSSDDQYPMLRGVHFYINGNIMEVTSTDGLRISYVKRELKDKEYEETEFILPIKAVLNLERFLLPDEGVKFLINVNENQFYAELEKIKMYTRLVRGEYPDVQEFIEREDFLFSILVQKDELKEVLDRVGVLLTPERGTVKFIINGNKMTITTETPELGFFEEDIDIINSNEEVKNFNIAFNQKFLLDFIDVVKTDEIEISFREKEGDEEKPVRVRGAGEKDYIYILMPYTV